MVVGLGAWGALETELNGLIELAGDTQRELTVCVTACLDLFPENHQPHVRGRAALAVATSTGERLHRLRKVRSDE